MSELRIKYRWEGEKYDFSKYTGCSNCDILPDNELCLDCQIEQADADVARAMRILEELKKEKEQQNA